MNRLISEYSISKKDDCFEENSIVVYELNRTFKKEDIEFLKVFKYLSILEFLPKPFIKIDRPGYFILKTAIGLNRIEVTYKRGASLVVRSIFEALLRVMLNPNSLNMCSCDQNALSYTLEGININYKKCTGCLKCIQIPKE